MSPLHAAEIGGYFTDDVTVELGEGSPPIKGRDTLIGMITRLQPRTAEFRLELDDVTIEVVPGSNAADVLLTATFTQPNHADGRAVPRRPASHALRDDQDRRRVADRANHGH